MFEDEDLNKEFQICQKKRYETKEEAEEAINHILKIDWSPLLRPYRCHICHNWHLTSKGRKK